MSAIDELLDPNNWELQYFPMHYASHYVCRADFPEPDRAMEDLAQLHAENARLTTQHETDKKLIVEHIKRESHYIPTVANLQKAVEEAERVIKECEWAIKYQDMGEHDCEACPICHNEYKHSPSCELGLWLTKYGR